MKTTLIPLVLAVFLLALVPAAQAGIILQPASASTDMGNFNGTSVPNNVIIQSGLSTGYTSLVTDFDSYIASKPTHNSNSDANIWRSAFQTTKGNFDFSLGGTHTIASFALWNAGGNNIWNVAGFELLASADSSFSSPTSLGSFTANANTGTADAVLPEVFTFTPTSAAFVRMHITSNWGDVYGTWFGEAAFEEQPATATVPEPGSVALVGLGALSLVGYGYRRRQRRRS
jgi:hypothetical protein